MVNRSAGSSETSTEVSGTAAGAQVPTHSDTWDESTNHDDGEDSSLKRAEVSSLQWSIGPDSAQSVIGGSQRHHPEESRRKKVHLLQLSRQKGKYEFNY